MTDQLQEVQEALRRFAAERDWERFHDPKNLAMLLASEAGELLSEYRWISNDEAVEWSKDPENLKRVKSEVADVGISLLMLCDKIGIDLVAAMLEKIEVNGKNYPVEAVKGKAERP